MAAATQTVPALLTLDEYLHTSYHPDCDYVDGLLEESNMGSTKHSLIEAWLAFWFISHQDEWNVCALSQLRTRVSSTRVRLPDIAVAYVDSALDEDVRITPPLIAIEILSPDDRLDRVMIRLADFQGMGIPHVWLLDPVKRLAHVYMRGELTEAQGDRISVPASPIYLDLVKLFAYLDTR